MTPAGGLPGRGRLRPSFPRTVMSRSVHDGGPSIAGIPSVQLVDDRSADDSRCTADRRACRRVARRRGTDGGPGDDPVRRSCAGMTSWVWRV